MFQERNLSQSDIDRDGHVQLFKILFVHHSWTDHFVRFFIILKNWISSFSKLAFNFQQLCSFLNWTSFNKIVHLYNKARHSYIYFFKILFSNFVFPQATVGTVSSRNLVTRLFKYLRLFLIYISYFNIKCFKATTIF